ncbi:tyrosine--tRNA ligase [Vibrio sp. V27_P1S3P104]|uniref:tyrosine--tRNA ligase n=1 Tax=unclassified Vibrio TaxID=2614977 RepID=UPI0013732594|nr:MULTISPECIES: tyrosine--tRNA ligase [unclassified Vibrio]NAW69456.1 tyrosine--tRNA ligase [Vibrio sp. V28_P6S34P95]NAX06406.1 tyrosine--tRNA ligase [Vibrio sp. V30_P3S12P165]NAX33375.1 tyrosine--tRNA ligase [Vibrio sp. V29_P1S30P107]NAX36203.1 tyrosine--tRNA ligase [Vibrio sp. V27_P1S3P104]NAX40480.1 tyrosine--tRNA ligase [Vibrio sp. V26_P1S5P106]
MNSHPLLNELNQRGLIAQSTPLEELSVLLSTPQTLYCGFDPTAGSLHIGHLVPLLMLKRFQDAGHQAIALIGGATGMIGDPSFKAAERSLNSAQIVQQWVADLSQQIQQVMSPHLQQPFVTVNNADWIGQISIIDFFRDVGKHFSVNTMINRESVKQRLARPDQGISFTEFSYSLLQSFDFAHLNQHYQCNLQIGGNDQWGNIVSGIDLTRRLNNTNVHGLTLPLITKSDGTKFGKTESGAVWLDANKTSPYAFYQFWLNTDDADVYRFLRYYTFLSLSEIEAIEQEDHTRTGKPQAQQILAQQLTQFVHGDEGLLSAQRITQALFSGEMGQLSLSELQQLELDGLPCFHTEQAGNLIDLLLETQLASSKRQAREWLTNGAIRVNGERVQNENMAEHFALFDRYYILQRGKKQFALLKLA